MKHKFKCLLKGPFLSFLFFIPIYNQAQTTVLNTKAVDSTTRLFFDESANIISVQDSLKAKFYRIINYKDGLIYGPVSDYYISGKLYMTGYYKSGSVSQGNENGTFTYFYESGEVFQIRNYKDGLLDGIFMEYYLSGIKKAIVTFSKGGRYGCEYSWDEKGNLIQKGFFENGIINIKRSCDDFVDTNANSVLSSEVFTKHFDFIYPNGAYNKVKFSNTTSNLFYKSNKAKIVRAEWLKCATYITDENPQGRIYLPDLYIDGFKQIDRQFVYTYSICTFLENGTILQKEEDIENQSYNDNFQIILSYKKPPKQKGVSTEILFINFLIKDKNSKAIIQGYFVHVPDNEIE